MQNFVWFEIGAFESFWSKILHGKIKFRYFVEKCPNGPNLRKMTVFGQMTVSGQNSSSQKFNFWMKMNKFRRNFEKLFFGDRLIDLEWNLSILELIHMLLLI